MRTSSLTLLFVIVVFVPTHQAIAQSPEMPEPLAILVDADGRPMVQVVDLQENVAWVLFEFDGDPVLSRFSHKYGMFSGGPVFFSLDNCMGDVYLNTWNPQNMLHDLNQRKFVIMGPDSITGTYRVFSITSNTSGAVFPESQLENASAALGICVDLQGDQNVLVTGQEVLPNPLAGFHGPTVANPERLLTVKGGTRLP